MTPKWLRPCVPVVSLFVLGCAARPDAGLTAARAALAAAIAAEAELYAESELASAERALERAEAALVTEDQVFVLNRDYDRVARLAAEATRKAELATSTVTYSKERVRQQAESAIRDALDAAAVTSGHLEDIKSRPHNRVLVEGLSIELNAIDEVLEEARLKVGIGQFMAALSQSLSAANRIDTIRFKAQFADVEGSYRFE